MTYKNVINQQVCFDADPYNIHYVIDVEKMLDIITDNFTAKTGYTLVDIELVQDCWGWFTFKANVKDERGEFIMDLRERIEDPVVVKIKGMKDLKGINYTIYTTNEVRGLWIKELFDENSFIWNHMKTTRIGYEEIIKDKASVRKD